MAQWRKTRSQKEPDSKFEKGNGNFRLVSREEKVKKRNPLPCAKKRVPGAARGSEVRQGKGEVASRQKRDLSRLGKEDRSAIRGRKGEGRVD